MKSNTFHAPFFFTYLSITYTKLHTLEKMFTNTPLQFNVDQEISINKLPFQLLEKKKKMQTR